MMGSLVFRTSSVAAPVLADDGLVTPGPFFFQTVVAEICLSDFTRCIVGRGRVAAHVRVRLKGFIRAATSAALAHGCSPRAVTVPDPA